MNKKTQQKKSTSQKKSTAAKRRLFRVIFRGHDYLGTGEQFHAKVVAPDLQSALTRVCKALGLDPSMLDSVAVTLVADETELADGKVFDLARRSRGFGERGAWTFKDVLPARLPGGPRKTELL